MAKWASFVFNTRKVYGKGYYSDSEMWKTIFFKQLRERDGM